MSASAAALLEQGLVENYCNVAACALYSYDRCITVAREVDLIWRRRRISVASALYLLLHISAAAYQYLNITILILTGCQSAYLTNIVLLAAGALFKFANGGFMALRAYAISNRSILLASTIFLLSLVDVGIDIYEACILFANNLPQPVGCELGENMTSRVYRIVTILEQMSNILPEALLVLATWRHAYASFRLANDAHVHTPLTTTLLRDGTLYFAAISIVLIANAALENIDTAYSSTMSDITYSLQAILLSRFYLNLREAHSTLIVGGTSNTLHMSDIQFTRIVGRLAGSISYDTDEYTADDTLEDSFDQEEQQDKEEDTDIELAVKNGSIALTLVATSTSLMAVEEVSGVATVVR
ncbi:hypothetical protein DAEQUDRAFT_733845 [Daedalea quercina L-15889]|uniref:DUF6533 domain-containing protein n=1 Tax=Daedalea quercina L-15889 TaxID=1314783 RepID=A0A165KPJ9_9APHY|nr:hypothetical protein DAEQUDRAFT_733845 [Daedalea quercina L-15889]